METYHYYRVQLCKPDGRTAVNVANAQICVHFSLKKKKSIKKNKHTKMQQRCSELQNDLHVKRNYLNYDFTVGKS